MMYLFRTYRSFLFSSAQLLLHINLYIGLWCNIFSAWTDIDVDTTGVPRTTDQWLDISEVFATRWNIPNVLFAVDGKRVLIQQPSNSGSHYYDYKGHNSILADDNLTMVAVGSEYGIWQLMLVWMAEWVMEVAGAEINSGRWLLTQKIH